MSSRSEASRLMRPVSAAVRGRGVLRAYFAATWSMPSCRCGSPIAASCGADRPGPVRGGVLAARARRSGLGIGCRRAFCRRRPVLLFAAAVASAAGLSYVLATGFAVIMLIAAVEGLAASAINPLTDFLHGLGARGPDRIRPSAFCRVRHVHADHGCVRGPAWAGRSCPPRPWLQATGYGIAAALSLALPEVASGGGWHRTWPWLRAHMFRIPDSAWRWAAPR